MAAEEQYDELLRLADEFLARGIIDWDERKDLVLEAAEHYARAVEAVWNSVWSCDSSGLARTKMKKPGAVQGAKCAPHSEAV